MKLKYKKSNFFGSTLNTVFGKIQIPKDGVLELPEQQAKNILKSYFDFEEVVENGNTITVKPETVEAEKQEVDYSLLTRDELIEFCVESGIEKSKVEKLKDKEAIIKILKIQLAKVS